MEALCSGLITQICFPSTAHKQCEKLALLSNSKAVNFYCSFVGLRIHSGRMIDQKLRYISLTIVLAAEIPIL